jgi:hypothetical protein
VRFARKFEKFLNLGLTPNREKNSLVDSGGLQAKNRLLAIIAIPPARSAISANGFAS